MSRVHNADYYMQEAKKLKHRADALVGFLPLLAFHICFEGKHRYFTNKSNFLAAALTQRGWGRLIPQHRQPQSSVGAKVPSRCCVPTAPPQPQKLKGTDACCHLSSEFELTFVKALETVGAPTDSSKPELVWAGRERVAGSWFNNPQNWLWGTWGHRYHSAPCCI